MLLGVRCEWLPATEKIWESEVRKQLWMESIAYCFFFFLSFVHGAEVLKLDYPKGMWKHSLLGPPQKTLIE